MYAATAPCEAPAAPVRTRELLSVPRSASVRTRLPRTTGKSPAQPRSATYRWREPLTQPCRNTLSPVKSAPPGPQTWLSKEAVVISGRYAVVHGPLRLGATAYEVRYSQPV